MTCARGHVSICDRLTRPTTSGSLAGKTPAQFIELLNHLSSNTRLFVRIASAKAPVTTGAVELANLPASASAILQAPVTPVLLPVAGSGARVADLEIDLKDQVVSGAKTLTLNVAAN